MIFEKPLLRVVRVLYGDHPELPSVSVYFQGCDAFPKCAGCHNPETWEFNEDFSVDFESLKEHVISKLQTLLKTYEKVSLALLGGEPLSFRNRRYCYLLAKEVKETFGDKVVVIVYSWRTPKELLNMNIPLSYFDEFVLGRYNHKYHRNGFPASANQLYLNKEQLIQILQIISARGTRYVKVS
ncbi:MAG: 4Fe-4S cluster-binding domain-containing protein [Fervidobacterium sp.]|uniref:4Fe-4S cluster-binding domain-containing protein n=1 Tax=Fervidobacterium TaxID=2422 RepID=UPI00309927A3